MGCCRGNSSVQFVVCAVLAAILIVSPSAVSQESGKTTALPASASQPDIVSHETTTFKVRVNNVLMRVVVTDAHGNSVGNLTKDNFEILDNGKPQPIASFSVLQQAESPAPVAVANATEHAQEDVREVAEPQQYFAYLFDDIHLGPGDLLAARMAARKHIISALKKSDRAALFTTSGRVSMDYTSDGAALLNALDRIQPLFEKAEDRNTCPWMDYYTADLIVNKNDPEPLLALAQQLIDCTRSQIPLNIAEGTVRLTAQRELAKGDAETKMSLSVLRDAVNDLAAKPGQRTLVLVSPGFLAQEEHYFDVSQDLDRALRSKVVINALDARGLWVDPTEDASHKEMGAPYSRYIRQYMESGARAEGGVLGELAYGTGGVWFHDNNDLREGFRRTATSPDVVYLIAFTLQNLKYDGKFHTLKLVLKNAPNLSVRTRKGYFAPKAAESAAEQAQSDIEDAVFSRDERQEIPVDLHTEFYRAQNKANVAVIAHVDLRPLQFRKQEGRNLNTLTVVSVLFDQDGHYVAGFEKKIDFHMRDEMLERQMRTGIAVKSNFTVDPGGYLVRVVVRDAEGEMMSAKNDTVRIPYN
jgi:VWFA-related protein